MQFLYSDRFIPTRKSNSSRNLLIPNYSKSINEIYSNNDSYKLDNFESSYDSMLFQTLLPDQAIIKNNKSSLLSFNYKIQSRRSEELYFQKTFQSSFPTISSEENLTQSHYTSPVKILSAPELRNDYYCNLLDWSSKDFIAVALRNEVYIWSMKTNEKTKLIDILDEQQNIINITSISWNQDGDYLAIATEFGDILIVDQESKKIIRKLNGHSGRIGCLTWNESVLASGSKDNTLMVRDIRMNNSKITILKGHRQEVCGLKWSFDKEFLASGGNDHTLNLWSIRKMKEVVAHFQHDAGVKAIGWAPYCHNLLGSGAGADDGALRIWDTKTLTLKQKIETGSQICNLAFSKNSDEIVTSHGFSQKSSLQGEVTVWTYPKVEKIKNFIAHTKRVLYMASSPCGEYIITGAPDETVKIWSLFPKSNNIGLFTKPNEEILLR